MTKLLSQLRSNAIAYAALFVALGGTSYAATNLPAGSVGSKQLRNGSVTAAKLAKGAVNANSLNSKTIAGHIAMWAQIRADGHVISSSPHATVVPYGVAGLERVTWPRSVSVRCIAVANAANVGPLTTAGTANATGPYPRKGSTSFVISTFNGGGVLTPEPVNVVVICP
jgi:hypothetical protein